MCKLAAPARGVLFEHLVSSKFTYRHTFFIGVWIGLVSDISFIDRKWRPDGVVHVFLRNKLLNEKCVVTRYLYINLIIYVNIYICYY